jgi:alkylhydroperoxidase/carboxymuconolactone decarboxylase family protein YurZ
MDHLLKLHEESQGYRKALGEALPGAQKAHDTFRDEVYTDAVLSAKTKRLIGIAVAVKSGHLFPLINCTIQAVKLGATKEEVMESVSVAIAMGGNSAIEYGSHVVKVLQEMGQWNP